MKRRYSPSRRINKKIYKKTSKWDIEKNLLSIQGNTLVEYITKIINSVYKNPSLFKEYYDELKSKYGAQRAYKITIRQKHRPILLYTNLLLLLSSLSFFQYFFNIYKSRNENRNNVSVIT